MRVPRCNSSPVHHTCAVHEILDCVCQDIMFRLSVVGPDSELHYIRLQNGARSEAVDFPDESTLLHLQTQLICQVGGDVRSVRTGVRSRNYSLGLSVCMDFHNGGSNA